MKLLITSGIFIAFFVFVPDSSSTKVNEDILITESSNDCTDLCVSINWANYTILENLREHFLGQCFGDPVCEDGVNHDYDNAHLANYFDTLNCVFSCLEEN